nr:MAG TPA: hypothetical protein [Caudoviricetes sp.]
MLINLPVNATKIIIFFISDYKIIIYFILNQ